MSDHKNEETPVGVAVVGFGMASRVFHLPTISAVPSVRLSAIVQRTGDEAQAAYPRAKVVRSVEALLEESDIELVVIATPHDSHFALAERCLLAGRHVVVDKPFTLRAAEAERLAAVARERGRIVSVFHNRRYDGDFLTVRDLLAKGTLGRLVGYEACYDRHRPEIRARWREQAGTGGLLYDLGPHLIDQALELFGTPESIAARISRERDGTRNDDAFELWFRYSNVQIRLAATMLAVATRPRFYLRGTLGSFVKYGVDPQEAALVAGDHYTSSHWGEENENAWGKLHLASSGEPSIQPLATHRGDYRAYYRDIATAIRTKRQPAVTSEHGVRVMRVIELAIESDKERHELTWR